MEKEMFYSILSHPYSLSLEEQEAMDKLVDKYPFFQAAQTLRLQNAYGEDNYNRILSQAGIHIPDPKHYYQNLMLNKMYVHRKDSAEEKPLVSEVEYAEPKEVAVVEKKDNIEQKETEITTLVEENQVEEENAAEDTLQYAPSFYKIEESVEEQDDIENEVLDFTDWFNALEKPVKKTKPLTTSTKAIKTAETISQFIKKEKKPILPPKIITSNEEKKEHTPEQFISQTLAEIYVKQKLYDKAISIYEKLDLNSSEKNTTFARRIKEINELKNN